MYYYYYVPCKDGECLTPRFHPRAWDELVSSHSYSLISGDSERDISIYRDIFYATAPCKTFMEMTRIDDSARDDFIRQYVRSRLSKDSNMGPRELRGYIVENVIPIFPTPSFP